MAHNQLLTTDELAELLGISPGTIRNWVYLRRIPFLKIGRCVRFDPETVMQRLERYNGDGWPEGRRG